MRDRFYSTADLARVCGVSISTIKRWTDAGLLRCVRTPGGHRKYRVQDVAEAARRLGLSGVDPEPRAAAAQVDELALLLLQDDRAALAGRLAGRLRAGDTAGTRQILLDLHRHGMPLAQAGELLAMGRDQTSAGVAASEQEAFVRRRAAQVAAATVRALCEQVPAPAAAAPAALVVTSPRVRDALAASLVLLLLADHGWRGVDLGSEATCELVRGGVRLERAQLVVLVVEDPEPGLAAELRAETESAGADLLLHVAGSASTLASLARRAAARDVRPLAASTI